MVSDDLPEGGQRLLRRGKRARRPRAFWAPAAVAVAICALALATPKNFAFSRLLPAAPALAASMWSVAWTLALGVVALVVVVIIEIVYDPNSTMFNLAAVAAVTAAAAYASHVRQQRERTLSKVRSVALAAQSVVLRPMPHRLCDLGIETLYLAAAEEARVGGDFYEALDTPYGVRLLIGDVRGKGLSAVGTAGAITNAFRDAAFDEPDLVAIARRLDTAMTRYSRAYGESAEALERFATAVFAQIPPGGPAELLNCGHPPPLLLHGGAVRTLDPSAPSPPITMASLIGGGYTVDTVPLAPGDRLLFYTDGVTETRDRTGTFFPLADWAAGQDALPPRALLDALHQQLIRYSGGALDDDIAALVVRRDPTTPHA
ncbi:PP2C family protein-serine/threonine phosphatase [Actinacidiphila rubida]|uniref:Serine phosphatase RsbU, regulator of sigma subunit n=1 Tax=Actinacidiphila rubida TaxID=310780 RepID=A0A1H8UXJ7_9ACTN|nr:PP2C family protein-serine/threonine phosphatase [Actinacidiphila rubida]SEP07674.1 Serine phosphatase RsbU, regulator of sigma subunit [Actinacidiphila rubida]